MTIIWSTKAEASYIKVLLFMVECSYRNYAHKLEEEVNNQINLILLYPDRWPKSKKSELRRAIILDDFLIIYKYDSESMEIVDFVDTRSNHSY
jgi:hypothetical protein